MTGCVSLRRALNGMGSPGPMERDFLEHNYGGTRVAPGPATIPLISSQTLSRLNRWVLSEGHE